LTHDRPWGDVTPVWIRAVQAEHGRVVQVALARLARDPRLVDRLDLARATVRPGDPQPARAQPSRLRQGPRQLTPRRHQLLVVTAPHPHRPGDRPRLRLNMPDPCAASRVRVGSDADRRRAPPGHRIERPIHLARKWDDGAVRGDPQRARPSDLWRLRARRRGWGWRWGRCGQDDRHLPRSEEHTSELQSRENLVCRLLLEKKKKEELNLYTTYDTSV